jgi:beta-phosphoglucomutase
MRGYPFDAVLFDMDGVVVDNTALNEMVWMEFADKRGLQVSLADVRGTNGRRAVDGIRLLFGELEQSEVDELAFDREVLYRQYLVSDRIEPVLGIGNYLGVLGELKVPRILATSATMNNVDVILSRLNIAHCFESIVSAEDVTCGKPDPEVYLKAAARASVAPEKCLVIEDAVPGVMAAKGAGAFALGLMTSQSESALSTAGADWVARDFSSLPEQLRPALQV